ncbi:hypothetical protein [Anaerorhabdus sp.]|jgi:CarD family transcriptional regulator|uniref:hypothetical protein n=1 Tax=Anaerorhabdus sp. TaxID=1872524 RepID=UPI002FC80C4A
MYKIGEKVIYKTEVCSVKEIKKNALNKEMYYILVPIFSGGCETTIQVPTSNKAGNVHELLTKEEIEQLVDDIPNIPVCDMNDILVKKEYEVLLKTNKPSDLVRIIKTTYLKNKIRVENNKKISSVDDSYFHEAERILYTQLSVVLEKTVDETRAYLTQKLGHTN